jgi:hypothetical protein
MKRAILCEVCRHQQCVFNARLHRQTMTCAVRPGVIAEQVICREFNERKAATWTPIDIAGSAVVSLEYIGNLNGTKVVTYTRTFNIMKVAK